MRTHSCPSRIARRPDHSSFGWQRNLSCVSFDVERRTCPEHLNVVRIADLHDGLVDSDGHRFTISFEVGRQKHAHGEHRQNGQCERKQRIQTTEKGMHGDLDLEMR